MNADVVVVGAGTVGAAIAYGLAGLKLRVLVLDGHDRDFRAASANFGLVWLQGKGMDMPPYQKLTRESVDLWTDFGSELTDTTGVDLQYEANGGLTLCLGEMEFETRRAKLMRLHNQVGGDDPDWEMLDRAAVQALLPRVQLGQAVVGASFGRRDGHTNPLRLLAALHAGILRRGGQLRGGCTVRSLQSDSHGGFTIDCGTEQVTAGRVVIAAGLGSKSLAAQVGLDVPLRPQRGQILVSERLEPFLPLPLHGVRQTREGTVMMGVTTEDVSFNSSVTSKAASAMSANAIRWLPALSEANLVRQWAGLRIMTPDGYPIYAQSESHPGAFVALCHSGITLASTHAALLAGAIAAGRLPPSLEVFNQRRFDVSEAA